VLLLYRWIHQLSLIVGFVIPSAIGWLYGGFISALGAFLIAGVARIVAVQQSTFCINSLCHTIGNRPYSSNCSARDSWIAALVTFGEGYHNYHHEFQHDYRNGVKPWQFDPTKWTIWLLSKIGLVSDLRRVPEVKILLAEIIEARRQIDSGLEILPKEFPESIGDLIKDCQDKLHQMSLQFNGIKIELQSLAMDKMEVSREAIQQWRREVHEGLEVVELLISNISRIKRTAVSS
jgi:stearoyl-CoA desaturase (delta-9 desaturase)